MTWGSGLVERTLRYPNMRREIKDNLRFLSDEDEQRRTLDGDSSLDPWSWDRLNGAIEDTFITGRPENDIIGVVLRNEDELAALQSLSDAIDFVLDNERSTFGEFLEAVTAPSWPRVVELAREALNEMDRDDAPPPTPSRDLARAVLEGIRQGKIDANDASHWTSQWEDDVLRGEDPFLADSMWHIWLSPNSGGRDSVDESVVAGWIDDLDHARPDFARLAANAMSHDWVRGELQAYGRNVEPRASNDPSEVSLKLIYWHVAGLAALPKSKGERKRVSEKVVQRMIDCGFPDAAARAKAIDFEDEAPRWKK